MERKLIFRNIICSLILQTVTIVSGFVIPKIILNHFGSEVNGLVSSINQFLNYIQLLEGGLSGVVMAALYKPLAENDSKKISAVVNAARNFFRQISIIYLIYMGVISIGYPLFVHTGFAYPYSIALVIVLGMNLFVQYFFSLAFKLLLEADRKVYLTSLTQAVIVLLNMIAVTVCTTLFADILIIKLVSAVVFFIQPIVYGTFVKKHYQIDKKEEPDHHALSQRWDGFGINLAYFIHTNTDVVILTVFSTLTNVSVYSVYLMVVNAMKNLVLAVSRAVIPSFGKALATDEKEAANKKFELYELGIYLITILIFTCGIFLITPFINVYTSGISDADYEQYLFGYLLTAAEMVYCLRDPYISAAYAAGHFRQITKYALTEAGLNLGISLVFVHRWGITGVAVGTLCSMIYRQIAHVFYLKSNILERSPMHFVKKTMVFGTAAAAVLLISHMAFDVRVTTYPGWFCLAAKVFVLCVVIVSAVAWLFYKPLVKKLANRISIGK